MRIVTCFSPKSGFPKKKGTGGARLTIVFLGKLEDTRRVELLYEICCSVFTMASHNFSLKKVGQGFDGLLFMLDTAAPGT